MFIYRTAGLLLVAAFLVGAAASAQQKLPPGVKVQPPAKPNVPMIPKGVDPKGKNNPGLPGLPPGFPQGKNNPGVGQPQIPPGGVVAPPTEKKDDIKWPTELEGRTLEMVIKEMRTHTDPSIREAAVRLLPNFGPKARDLGANDLVDAMTKDQDWNVRMAAMNVAPTILLGFAKAPDAALNNGFTAILNYLSNSALNVRFEAIGVVASIGPYMRKAQPSVIKKLTDRTRESSSWQMRRAGVRALASVGQGEQTGESPEMRTSPDAQAVYALLDALKSDHCALVRLEAVNALIALGPVAQVQHKIWRTTLDNVYKLNTERDNSVLLWTHVLIIRNSPGGLMGNESHLDEIAKTLEVAAPAGRMEACAALGMLGEDAKSKLQNLIDLVNKPKEFPEVVAAAIMAMTSMPSKSAVSVPILVNLKATHKDKDVQTVASEAIDMLTGKKKK